MVKLIMSTMLVLGISLSASAGDLGIESTKTATKKADGKSLTTKCVACHGASFEKVALGKAKIVKGQIS
jgi:cytochrome c553